MTNHYKQGQTIFGIMDAFKVVTSQIQKAIEGKDPASTVRVTVQSLMDLRMLIDQQNKMITLMYENQCRLDDKFDSINNKENNNGN